MLEPKLNCLSLNFLEAERKFDLEPYLTHNWSHDWYVTMLRFPKQEMMTKEFIKQAEELMDYGVLRFQDQPQLNRPVRAGDIITNDLEFWLVIPTKRIPENARSAALHKWPDVSLLFIGELNGTIA